MVCLYNSHDIFNKTFERLNFVVFESLFLAVVILQVVLFPKQGRMLIC